MTTYTAVNIYVVHSIRALTILLSGIVFLPKSIAQEALQPVKLNARIQQVQPMTGIVLWTTNEAVESAPIQLEYAYLTYREVTKADGTYNWEPLEKLLQEVATRKHQLILRWHDTYVGKKTGIPDVITKLPDYRTIKGKSEKKQTEFPDWSHPALQKFALQFFTDFAKRYDNDRRLAFVQVGFGLWAEYHIYDGPMKLGTTFPSKEYQTKFLKHMNASLVKTPWMISVDAADSDWTPLEDNDQLLKLSFGLFDDSFNHKRHEQENVPNWKVLGMDRWRTAPMGGEFAFFDDVEQRNALAANGPYGTSFESHAARFHSTFIIGDAQPNFQKPERIRQAGRATGYAFRVTRFESAEGRSLVEVQNTGIAPIYYDAFPAVNGRRSDTSLKGLLPGESKSFRVASGGPQPVFTIECDRLVDGQKIEFDASLP